MQCRGVRHAKAKHCNSEQMTATWPCSTSRCAYYTVDVTRRRTNALVRMHHACMHANKQTSKQANKQTSKQANKQPRTHVVSTVSTNISRASSNDGRRPDPGCQSMTHNANTLKDDDVCWLVGGPNKAHRRRSCVCCARVCVEIHLAHLGVPVAVLVSTTGRVHVLW